MTSTFHLSQCHIHPHCNQSQSYKAVPSLYLSLISLIPHGDNKFLSQPTDNDLEIYPEPIWYSPTPCKLPLLIHPTFNYFFKYFPVPISILSLKICFVSSKCKDCFKHKNQIMTLTVLLSPKISHLHLGKKSLVYQVCMIPHDLFPTPFPNIIPFSFHFPLCPFPLIKT